MRNSSCSALVAALAFGLSLTWIVASPESGDCSSWADSIYGYSVCLPNDWFKRTMPSGALFLCDDRRGACTTAVGGFPLLGHATLSVIPAQVALEDMPPTLEEFAHRLAGEGASSQFSEIISLPGRFAPIRLLIVSQTFTTGARNEVPQLVYRYFAQADHKMFEFILTFNSGDRRSKTYRDAVLRIITSMQPRL